MIKNPDGICVILLSHTYSSLKSTVVLVQHVVTRHNITQSRTTLISYPRDRGTPGGRYRATPTHVKRVGGEEDHRHVHRLRNPRENMT
ncbi:hypothetical protein PUN28_015544 [Cardiocondyla obscurior]|uniref:Secreted protein n=1 Tax=Cardiocondyla obscurior TaxID=286306 RepID=A0AAW2EWT6_9HYME